jgi:hypothetical protein
MKPVFQTIYGYPDGNCFQAAAASIFEMSLDEVPHFWKQYKNRWWDYYVEFCMERGLYPLNLPAKNINNPSDFFHGYHLITVKVESGLSHSVVGLDGIMVYDPHPGGLKAMEIESYDLFVSLMEEMHE